MNYLINCTKYYTKDNTKSQKGNFQKTNINAFHFSSPPGVVGILPTENRLPVTMGDFINLSLLSHT